MLGSNINDIENSDAVSNQHNTTNSSSANNTNSINANSTTTAATQCTHLWGQWEVKERATCQAPGTKERSCHNCHINETEKIKTIEHKESDWIIDSVA